MGTYSNEYRILIFNITIAKWQFLTAEIKNNDDLKTTTIYLDNEDK